MGALQFGNPGATLLAVRAGRPLVHCITNHVTSGLVANVLLALGASPAMVEGEDEVAAFTARAGALAINLGTLTPGRAAAMRLAAAAAARSGVPWVLDPVAAGALPARAALAAALLLHRPAVVRGNASEIKALAGAGAGGRGPETEASSADAVPAARALAREAGVVAAVTGAVDYVADGTGTHALRTGHPMMARVSGMGCAATAVIAACLAVEPDPMRAALHGLAILGRAGALAAADAAGPGSLAPALLDALFTLQPEALDQVTATPHP